MLGGAAVQPTIVVRVASQLRRDRASHVIGPHPPLQLPDLLSSNSPRLNPTIQQPQGKESSSFSKVPGLVLIGPSETTPSSLKQSLWPEDPGSLIGRTWVTCPPTSSPPLCLNCHVLRYFCREHEWWPAACYCNPLNGQRLKG